jgi:uncharacterized membrane protein YkgB
MSNNKSKERDMIISFLTLRKAVGILGIALPLILLIAGEAIFQLGLRTSISSYYHTGMGDVLVGTLFAFGTFLVAYRGYDKRDEIAGILGGIFAVGVALFPTTLDDKITSPDQIVGILHVVFTAAFFATLIYSSLFLFTLSNKKPPTKEKRRRNAVYRVCGVVMIICIVGIVIGFFFPSIGTVFGDSLVFWMEALAIWAFGVSWFAKGEAIGFLND